MTLKQQEVVKQLPQNGYNIAKTMRKVGYTDSTSNSGQQYGRIRKLIEKAYNPEQIKADIRRAEADFAKAGDNSNRARMLELRAKVCGLGRDTTINQVNIIQDKDIQGIADRVHIDRDTQHTDTQQHTT